MALDMTPEQKEIGKGNFHRVVGKLADTELPNQTQADQGVTRRGFMQGLVAAAATVPVPLEPVAGAAEAVDGPPPAQPPTTA